MDSYTWLPISDPECDVAHQKKKKKKKREAGRDFAGEVNFEFFI